MRGILTVALISAAAIAMAGEKDIAMQANEIEAGHPYVGLWATDDGHVRQRLLPNGRHVEVRGSRETAYQGRYEVTGDHIEYWDDTGFTPDGEFADGVLHHGGMVMRRQD